jgi:hypothetical protein
VTYDGDAARLYVNGTCVATNTAPSGTLDGGVGLALGTESDEKHIDWFYDGVLDEVRIYNRALSADEIVRL